MAAHPGAAGDDPDRGQPAGVRRLAAGLLVGQHGGAQTRQIDVEGRTLTHSGLDLDATTGLGDDAEDRGQPEAGALAGAFRRVEGIEDPGLSGLVHATSRVGYADPNRWARAETCFRSAGADRGEVMDPNGQGASGGHRIAGVDREIDDHLLELSRIHSQAAVLRLDVQHDGDIVAQQWSENRDEISYHLGRVYLHG